MKSKPPPPDISTDLFLNGKLEIFQLKDAFKSGSDAVFLSAMPETLSGKVLEVGCGTGVVSLCLAKRFKNAKILGIDLQERLIHLATESAKHNQLDSNCTFLQQDLQNTPFESQSFDALITNPPYFNLSSPSPIDSIKTAKNHVMDPKEWISLCGKLIKPKGYFYCIYPATQLDFLIQQLTGFGNITIYPLWSKAGVPAKRVLVKAQKNSKTPLTLCGGLILHNEDGSYTKEAQSILKDGNRIKF